MGCIYFETPFIKGQERGQQKKKTKQKTWNIKPGNIIDTYEELKILI